MTLDEDRISYERIAEIEVYLKKNDEVPFHGERIPFSEPHRHLEIDFELRRNCCSLNQRMAVILTEINSSVQK